jgi:homoserine dehydrogenase
MILSEMMDIGCSFNDALHNTQRLGIAEADPSLDTHGWDTANKITIIANAVFDAKVKVTEISRDGIEHVTQAHINK